MRATMHYSVDFCTTSFSAVGFSLHPEFTTYEFPFVTGDLLYCV